MNSDAGNLVENIYPLLIFRDEAAFRIPKSIREKGYIQSVDIYIDSISWSLYENGKSLPPIQFYGYAQLVLQDACTLEVPIHFPRQRLWFYRVESALSQWRDIDVWLNTGDKWWRFLFDTLFAGETEPPVIPPFRVPDTNFIESPLREIFIKCPSGTQFEVEITQWEPVPFDDDQGNGYDGKSNQIDGDKDAGLPSEGIQPKRNPSENPFVGNPDPTAISPLNPFFSSKDKLFAQSESNPVDIPATTTTEGVYIEVSYPICSSFQVVLPVNPLRTLLRTIYVPCKLASVVEVTDIRPRATPSGCEPLELRDYIITETSFSSVGDVVVSSGSINGIVKYGLLPTGAAITEI